MPQYQGVWSLQQQMQALTSGQWATDPNFNNTTLLLQADGTGSGSQNQTFLDSSTNNFFITRNGNTTQGTFSPFSATGWGNYFGSAADFISIPDSANTQLGSGDFTLEFWTYLPNAFTTQWITGKGDAATGAGTMLSFYGTLIQFYSGGTNYDISIPSGTWTLNTWLHVAIVRTGTASGNLRLYVNGQLINSASIGSNTINTGGTNPLKIGSYAGTGPVCYISNYRLVKGTALYTSAFFPPTLPLTAVSGTTVLTCQSNRFIDNSSAPATVTVSGTPSVQPFSPFAPQYQWTSDVIGGSAYFDGSTDYLTWTGSSITTSQFCFECWFYCTGTIASDMTLLGIANTTSGSPLNVRKTSATNISIDAYGVAAYNFTVPTMYANTWYHVAAVRGASNVCTVFLNGVRSSTGTQTLTNNFGSSSSIGYLIAASPLTFTGYIAGTRLIVGSTPYDPTQTTITIPTAPPTAVANTQLLLNYTNAGILDGTMKNNLETVGNAQVSTSVVKYGSGSMYNPGTTGSYLTRSVSSQLFVFPGDFTIEFWAWKSANGANAYDTPVSCDSDGNATNGWSLELGTVRYMFFVANGGAFSVTSSTINPNDSAWHHYAVTRSGSTVRLFRDGTQIGSGTYSAAIGNSSIPALKVFAYGNATTNSFNGYIDDLRITNGIARYTQNFIPPSVALPRQ